MNSYKDQVEYPVFYCIQCNSTTMHETVSGGRKRCRRCGCSTGSTVIRENLPLEEGEEIMMEIDPINPDLEEPVLE